MEYYKVVNIVTHYSFLYNAEENEHESEISAAKSGDNAGKGTE